MLGPMLLTRHNLQHYQDLMRGIRAAIEGGRWAAFREERAALHRTGDLDLYG
jgi:queuine tRNA-ribosyltransferase